MTQREGGRWSEGQALAFLKTVGVNPIDQTFEVTGTDLGLTGLGALDFLCHYCGYNRKQRTKHDHQTES